MSEDAREKAAKKLAPLVRRNLKALMAAAQEERITGPANVLALEATSGVGKSTIYRILDDKGENDTSMGNLQALAECYGFDAWHMLREQLNVSDPDELDAALAVYHQIGALADSGRTRSLSDYPRAPRPGRRDPGNSADTGTQPKNRPKTPRP